MARYRGPKEKLERRIGVKLSLKGERSLSPKAAMVRRPYPPGMHGNKRLRRLSEYGTQLKTKQKVRYIYRLMEKKFRRYVDEAMKSRSETAELLVRSLEQRLDNIIYRSGIAQSRDQARQIVNHGHILVNGKKVSIPSYQVKKGDIISIRPGSQKTKFFSTLVPDWIEKISCPSWMNVDTKSQKATITGVPNLEESGLEQNDLKTIVEFYSR
ncbi:MAG: 30S ribosomal protein S4 [Candidatus Yanofskybacteria bacterium CG10_big_fil_rev_8_21_14_0_10_46_23]|uniref:Small ribosomal subunit protein uS4 n=1 Tax=Candidatus Yanofskybacteria bacterium CG10_big_fil_rev_8_21_14_0_10_46_23 TaxID=1975098 RepID=A0A2H0R4N8_9BACT|nr:MAG: 30S ribosomal protein S4 [Candidatus Yanofskybacteria bacterium CG10_big_fil_rev_8_21_14_0_10_46_23]